MSKRRNDPNQLYLPIENWTPEELRARKQEEQARLAEYLKRKPPHHVKVAAVETRAKLKSGA